MPSPRIPDQFTPKLVTVLREGYGLPQLRHDALAGLTVAIVALPLSMAIAIASGAKPENGLFTAIVGGFLISLLGGSRFQIGGPAGAFIVIVAGIIERHGYGGLITATFLAGLILVVVGRLRLGAYIKFIPYPVTVGFTAGIATIIFASQLRDTFGLTLDKEPAAFIPKIVALWEAAPTVSPAAVAIAALGLGTIVAVRRFRPTWPSLLISVVVTSLAVVLSGVDVATIGSRFGGVPGMLPPPALPDLSPTAILTMMPDAITIALLGGIESLLSAVVADGMTGRRHRSNAELVAQGVANVATSMLGGIPATGTIARTATNVRSRAHGPVSGMLHALYLLVFMLAAAPVLAAVPLAGLAAILLFVSWNMAEKHEVVALVRSSPGDAVVLIATYLLTVFVDLMTGIAVGVAIGSLLFMHRMAQAVEIDVRSLDDQPDERTVYDEEFAGDPDLVVYRISGPFFFGATATAGSILDRIGKHPKTLVLDFAGVPFVDSTGANMLSAFVDKMTRGGTAVVFSSASATVRRALENTGLGGGRIRFVATLPEAVAEARGGAAPTGA